MQNKNVNPHFLTREPINRCHVKFRHRDSESRKNFQKTASAKEKTFPNNKRLRNCEMVHRNIFFFCATFAALLFVAQAQVLEGQVETGSFNSLSLRPTINAEGRQYEVYLPPSFKKSKHYPLVIWLHGTELNHLDYPEVQQVADELMSSEKIRPFVIVKPDGNWYPPPLPETYWDVPLMPSWWTNSPVFGNYVDFIADELVDEMHNQYGIDKSRVGIMGHSAGGYGALLNAFQRPDAYVAVASHSGVMEVTTIADHLLLPPVNWFNDYDGAGYVDLNDFAGTPTPPGPTTEQSPALGYFSDLYFKMNYVFSPRNDFDWDLWNGEIAFDSFNNIAVGTPGANTIQDLAINQDTWNIWEGQNILNVLDRNMDEVSAANLRLYFDVGKNDDFALADESIRTSQQLLARNIDHIFIEFDTGRNCTRCPSTDVDGDGNCNVPSGAYRCGKHFPDSDGLPHGPLNSRFWLGPPYTGSLRSSLYHSLQVMDDAFCVLDRGSAGSLRYNCLLLVLTLTALLGYFN